MTTTTNYNTFEYYSESGASCTFPVVKNIFPLLVVTSHSEILAGGASSLSTSYRYKDLRRHVQGKGVLGFGEVSSTTFISSNRYHKKQSVYAYDVNKYFPYLKKETLCLNGVDSISTVENTYNLRNEGGLSFFPYLQKVREKDHLTGFESVTTASSYNIHGFPLSVTVQKGSALTQTTVSTYDSIISPTKRILGIPKLVTRTTQRGGSSWIDKTSLTNNATLGIPTKKLEYVNNSYLKSTEDITYNSFGETLTSSLKPYNSTTALVTSYQYSANGRGLIQKTDPVGLSESYTYDTTRGLLATKTDYRGNVTSFEYDPMMRTKRVVYPDGTRDSVYYSWSTGAPNSVYCVTETHSNQPTTKTYYDLAGNEVRKSVQHFDGIFAQTDKTYNRFGLLNSVSYPYRPNESSVLSTYTYDNYLRLTGISEPSGRNTTYSYSGGSVTETKNGLAVTRTTNAAGELISTSDAGGTTTNTLRPDGNPSVITSNGVVTTFGYDSYGRKTSMTDPSAGMTRYTYNASGFMDSTINARNKVSQMVYDIYGNKTSVKMSDITVNYTYNSYKEPLKEQTSTGFYHEVTYDNQGRLATEKWSRYNYLSLLKAYTYSNGNLSTISYTTHDGLIATEQYIYAYGHLKQIKLNNDTIIWELKGVNGFSQSLQIATGPLTRNYSYTYGFPTNRNVKLGSTYLVNQDYTFNPATGNLTSRTMHGLTENFTYDNLNRLTGFGGKSVSYNPKGNITSKSDAGTFSYANDESPYSVTGITLSGDGIPPRSQSTTYKSFNALSSVTENSKVVSYDFGEGFERIRRRDINASTGAVVSMRYYFGPQYEIEISGGTTNITKEILYLCNGDGYSSPVAYVKTNGVWSPYYISRDYLGSITHLYNSSGSLVQELSYDAWGRLRNPLTNAVYSPDSEPSPFLNRGYTGHEHLTAFGLIHMNARAYDPAVGRFLSPDPYVVDPDFTQAYNRYSYCMNNPLVYTDESGEFIFTVLAAIFCPPLLPVAIGADIGMWSGGSMANGTMNPLKWDYASAKTWKYMAGGSVVGAVTGLTGGFVAGLDIPLANTAAIASSSLVNSLGMKLVTGGQTDAFISFGVASYNFNKGEWGYLGKKGNSLIDNVGYGFGALVNGYDVYKGVRSGQISIKLENNNTNNKTYQTQESRYSDDLLRKAQEQYPKKAGRIEQHHVIPKYIGGDKNGTLVPLDGAYHQVITNEFRANWPYGQGIPSDIQRNLIINDVYSKYPLPKYFK